MGAAADPMENCHGDRWIRLAERLATHACWVVPLLALLAGVWRVGNSWDDGAITVAFARTLAETGTIALTPTSERVEGFSSLNWMLILAAGYRFIHSLDGMLVWAKVASAICFSGALFWFRRLAARFLDGVYAPLAVVLLAFTVTPFVETVNGMEMNLYMLLMVLLAEMVCVTETASPVRLAWAIVLSCAALSTRFEAPVLLFFLYVGVWTEFRQGRVVAWLASANAVYFTAIEAWRRLSFGIWLPNTILAKRWVPYSAHGARAILRSRYEAIGEITTVLGVPIVLLGILWVVSEEQPAWSAGFLKRISPLLCLVTAGALLLDMVIGKSWGHPGRMILAYMPFLVLLLVSCFRAIAPTRRRVREAVLLAVVAGQMAEWGVMAYAAAQENAASVSQGEAEGYAVDQIRTLLHREKLVAFIPDVGGSALCCEKMTVLDSGLLANRYLAERGFHATPEFLKANPPDVIEAHWPWAQQAGLYANHSLDGFSPVGVKGIFLFVRKDLYAQLLANGLHETPMKEGGVLCGEKDMPELKVDRDYMAALPRCIHLPD